MGKSNHRPLILVTNDDGYKARGLEALTNIAREFGDVVVMASNESQSGKSHSITIKDPIRYKKLNEEEGFLRYIVRGTPADGIKLALCSLLKKTPDLILSGINHGTNSSTSVVYSGTMAAAIEGAIHQIPSIGFSILDYMPDADFEAATPYVRHLVEQSILLGIPTGTCLNVNIPAVPREKIKGIKLCRQTNGYWKETFETREDPRGSNYSWLSGSFINREPEAEDTDEWALRNNFISVVPVKTDFTDMEHLSEMRSWEEIHTLDEKK
jgi:5'-nucleotidase